MNVYYCEHLACFPGSLPLSARFSIFLCRLGVQQILAVFCLHIKANSVFDSVSAELSRLFDVLSMGYIKFCGRITFLLLQFFV